MSESDSRKSCLNNVVWVNVLRMLFKNYKHEVWSYSDPFSEHYIATTTKMTSGRASTGRELAAGAASLMGCRQRGDLGEPWPLVPTHCAALEREQGRLVSSAQQPRFGRSRNGGGTASRCASLG